MKLPQKLAAKQNYAKALAMARMARKRPDVRASNSTAQTENNFNHRADKLLRRFSWETAS